MIRHPAYSMARTPRKSSTAAAPRKFALILLDRRARLFLCFSTFVILRCGFCIRAYRSACPIPRVHTHAGRHQGIEGGRPMTCVKSCFSCCQRFGYASGLGKCQGMCRLTSQLIASLAIAANPLFHNHRSTSVVASTPACSGLAFSE